MSFQSDLSTCQFRGGLGNQLFQIAQTIAKNSELFAFNLNNYVQLGDGDSPQAYADTLYKLLPRTSLVVMATNPFEHNYQNWCRYENIIQSALNIELVQDNYCAIHFRGGDYFKHPRFSSLGKSYYSAALQYIPSNATKFVITNDYTAASKVFTGYKNLYILPSNSTLDNFKIMAQAQYKIIANSTFSWWASWFTKGYTIAPKTWLTTQSNLLPIQQAPWLTLL
jgi:hypothetical protein